MKISPFYDRIILEELAFPDEKTSGGLVLPQAGNLPRIGKIVAMGPNRKGAEIDSKDINFKVGDTVIWLRHMGSEMPIGGKKLWVVRFEDLLGLVEDEGGK